MVPDMKLEKLVVLFLDCQTTNSNPKKGNVIEIGWACSNFSRDNGVDATSVNSYLLKQPVGHEIPERIHTITGIRRDEVDAGHEPREVWSQLLSAADEIARLNRFNKCPLVIHYAKFETPFLIHLHTKYSAARGFPFKIICTHVLAKRLFPELPRRSLRAMAGYLGYSVGQARRCRDHVVATAFVWQALVRVLKERLCITTFEKLQQWLDQPMLSTGRERTYPMARETRRDVPDKPGVYRMLRSNGDVLYVGKASSLKKRVNSYFRRSCRHPEHILEMLSQAKQLDVTVTESVLEAAILESDEIKRLSPPYNVALSKGQRDVWYCSPNLLEFSQTLTKRCRIGPLVSQDAVARLAVIRQVVKKGNIPDVDDARLMAALGIPEGYTPDHESTRAGFAAFLEKYAQQFDTEHTELVLKEIGNELWLERLAEKKAEIEEPDEFELESMKVPMWTPTSVCHLLESNVMRGSYELRRTRWLVLLSESSLAWEEMRDTDMHRYVIVLEKGRVLYRRTIDTEEIPVPPGYVSSYAERQRSFDLKTADRLRVITTEIRKAVTTDSWVKLCLRPAVVMDNERLLKMFKWI